MSALDRPLFVTLFQDAQARIKGGGETTLRDLAEKIRVRSAPKKEGLRWLKLAQFGDAQTQSGSYRFNDNVLAIEGLEADYDGGEISFDQAVETLLKGNVAAVVYTSPSHTPEKPRWRILAPFSAPLEPEIRDHMMGRLNGLFRGALAGESWTLSQSYFYGYVEGNAANHKVELVDGDPIDTLDDLDETWRGKPLRAVRFDEQESGPSFAFNSSAPLDVDQAIEAIQGRGEYHRNMFALLASMAAKGAPRETAKDLILQVLDGIAPERKDSRWRARRSDRHIEPMLDWIYAREEKRLRVATGQGFSEAREGGESFFREAGPEPGATKTHSAKPPIVATPFVLADPSDIPPREWLYGKHLIRKFASATISPGGIGKSSLTIVEALAMVTGRKLLHDEPVAPARVWLWNGEDPRDELQRRISAACRHYGIRRQDLEGRLFVDTGREQEIIIARRFDRNVVVLEPLVEAIVATIRENKIDAMIVDPFVSSHRVSENANEEIERVTKTWAKIADITNTAIELVHHSRKTPNEVTVDDARGASALRDAVRSARALNGMTEEEAERYGVEDTWRFFRSTNGKANLAPRSDDSSWFRMESVPLNNGTAERPGDVVGVVTPWEAPGVFADITGDQAVAILTAIDRGLDNGQRYGHGRGITPASERSAVRLMRDAFGISEGCATRIAEAWIDSGVLVVRDHVDPTDRRSRKGLYWDRSKTGDS